MPLTRSILATLVVAPLLALPARGQTPATGADEIERLYAAIDASPGLSTEERLRRKCEVAVAGVEAGAAYLGAVEEMTETAKLARDAGMILEAGVPKLDAMNKRLLEFQETLEKGMDRKSLKAFGATAGALEQAQKAAALLDEIQALSSDPNLPPSAKRTLFALRATAEVMAGLGGRVPLVGAPIEAYGEMLREMTGAVRKVAADVTSLKGGGFSLTEEHEILQGLPDDRSYVRTGLFSLGLPVVMDLDTTPEDKEQPAYIRTGEDTWRKVDYGELSTLVAQYRVLNQDWLGAPRNPTPEEIAAILDDPTKRERLADRATSRIRREIAEEFLAETGLSNVSAAKVEMARAELLERLHQLGVALPPGGPGFRRLLEGELAEPGSSEAHLRRMALRSNPLLADYLAVKGVDPQKATLDQLSSHLRTMRADPARAARALGAAAPSQREAPTTADVPTSAPATEEARLDALCKCIMRDRIDWETRPDIKRQCPSGVNEIEVVVPAAYDRQKRACVGRFVQTTKCRDYDSLYKVPFDWGTTLMSNPPTRKYPEGCCTVFPNGKCWR